MAALAAIAACAVAFAWVHGDIRRIGLILRALRAVLAASMLTTEGILLAQGRWREALPLHLCSVSALCALALPAQGGQRRLDFLGYLGMPGALLALIFPAPAVSRWQALLNASYYTTHALILVMPLCLMAAGRCVRRGRALPLFLGMQGLALAAFFVNGKLGTDYLFLMAPPAGTPLEAAFALGRPAYLLALEVILAGMLVAAACLLRALRPLLPE